MKIIPLSEGSFTVDGSKEFIPFNLEKDALEERGVGSLLVEVQPFVVVTETDKILLDTGLGFFREGELQLVKNLKVNGIVPQQITKVVLSHLHKDHAGGISYRDRLGHYHISFPNATYYVHQQELEAATLQHTASYNRDAISILHNEKNVVLLQGDEGKIGEKIRWQKSGGHSKNHIVIWIEEAGRQIFFGGDEAPQFQQLKNKFIAKYDYNGRRAMELRQQWKAQGQREGWTFLFYHDIKRPEYTAMP